MTHIFIGLVITFIVLSTFHFESIYTTIYIYLTPIRPNVQSCQTDHQAQCKKPTLTPQEGTHCLLPLPAGSIQLSEERQPVGEGDRDCPDHQRHVELSGEGGEGKTGELIFKEQGKVYQVEGSLLEEVWADPEQEEKQNLQTQVILPLSAFCTPTQSTFSQVVQVMQQQLYFIVSICFNDCLQQTPLSLPHLHQTLHLDLRNTLTPLLLPQETVYFGGHSCPPPIELHPIHQGNNRAQACPLQQIQYPPLTRITPQSTKEEKQEHRPQTSIQSCLPSPQEFADSGPIKRGERGEGKQEWDRQQWYDLECSLDSHQSVTKELPYNIDLIQQLQRINNHNPIKPVNHWVVLRCLLQNLLNRSRKESIFSFWQEMTSLMKGTLLVKNSPGNAFMFYQAQICLANSIVSAKLTLVRSTITVAQRAPAECPKVQQSSPLSPSLSVCWLIFIISMHQFILLSFSGLLRIQATEACRTVLGIRITLKIPLSKGRQKSLTDCEAQRMIHPSLHPGPRQRLVRPEHLKMVTCQASQGETSSENVLEVPSYIMPQQIQSARMGKFLLLLSSSIFCLLSTDQLDPNGLEGSLIKMNFVLPSINFSIYSIEAFHLSYACKWQSLGSTPILLAMVSANGKPGEGNKKLSPSPASKFMVAQIARLPPHAKNTSSLVTLQEPTWNLLATASLAESSP